MTTASPYKKIIGLVKLAALGDVAQAARALNQFSHSVSDALEINWVIDAGLIDLARALVHLKPGDQVTYRPVSAVKLFQGSVFSKALQAISMLQALFLAKPCAILVLHRDARYAKLFSFFQFFKTPVFSISRSSEPELSVYKAAFKQLAAKLALTSTQPIPMPLHKNPTGRVGILVGGASNAKLNYPEKRWPYLEKFISLLEKTGKKIVLFGSKEDEPIANGILKNLKQQGQNIENKTGKTLLKDLPAEMQTLDAFVSIDSGLAHIAAAVMRADHQKIITLFGPTNPAVWGPISQDSASVSILYKKQECSPCYLDDGIFSPCKFSGEQFQKCMKAITPEEVLSLVLK